MNIVYLIGNGFDINLGLKTTPRDFLSDFVSRNLNSETTSPSTELASTIQDDGIVNWADFERKLGEYSARFNEDGIADYLEAVDALADHLHTWLSKQDESISRKEIQNNALKMMGSLKDFRTLLEPQDGEVLEKIKKAHDAENWHYNIISFNYTSALKRMFDLVKQNNSRIGSVDGHGRFHVLDTFEYAHGELNGIIVTGVDSEEQIASGTLRTAPDVANNIIKERIQRQLSTNQDIKCMKLISSANVICVFGMSMGISDRRWWCKIAQQLKNRPETILIIFSYDFSIQNPHTPFKRFNIMKEEKARFYNGAGIHEQDQEIIDSRIFILKSSSIFPFEASE